MDPTEDSLKMLKGNNLPPLPSMINVANDGIK